MQRRPQRSLPLTNTLRQSPYCETRRSSINPRIHECRHQPGNAVSHAVRPTIWNSVLSARRDSHLILNNHLYSPRIVDNTDKTTKKHERSGSNNISS